MTRILHIGADELLLDAVRLGRRVYESGFRPRHAISIWRGGTPVGLGVDAYFRHRGLSLHHSTIATDSYTGIGEHGEVTVRNLEHLVEVVCPEDGLLIIDDVYESGNTIARIVQLLRQMARANTPQDIRVATVHRKPGRSAYSELPVLSLRDIDDDVWIDYPHELVDLVTDEDPLDSRIRQKNEEIWQLLHQDTKPPADVEPNASGYHYVSGKQLLLDAIQLGVAVSRDTTWQPDFLVALWPGGVLTGLPVHEVFKYFRKKSGTNGAPLDHISIDTWHTHSSLHSVIAGLQYLEGRVNYQDNLLIVDTTFRAGRLVNALVMRLKEVLRRNLDHRRIRVASVYYNPHDRSTWTVRPDIQQPHYFVKRVQQPVIGPLDAHELPDARRDLRRLHPELAAALFEP